MATIVQRNREISQAITYFYDDNPTLFSLQPQDIKEAYRRPSSGGGYTGMIYAVYMLTDLDVINFQIEMDGNQGINNCAFDLYNVQGFQTRDSGILFCKKYQTISWGNPDNRYTVCYENPYGMRFNDSLRIVVKNLSQQLSGRVLQIMILYATVCD